MSLPAQIAASLNAHESGDYLVTLLDFTHDDLAEPVRLCDVAVQRITTAPITYGCVSNGDTYTYINIAYRRPEQISESQGRASIGIDNTGLELVTLLRSISSPISVQARIAHSSDLDTPFEVVSPMKAVTSSISAEEVVLELQTDILSTLPFPGRRLDVRQFPGMFV